MENKKYVSLCCNAETRTEGMPDFIGDGPDEICTLSYFCTKCNKPCNVKVRYLNAICRGSIELGSACLKCDRCKDEIEARRILSQDKMEKRPIDEGHENLMSDITALYVLCKSHEFHDFKNEKFATPKVELRNRLLAMAENVVQGRYDNT